MNLQSNMKYMLLPKKNHWHLVTESFSTAMRLQPGWPYAVQCFHWIDSLPATVADNFNSPAGGKGSIVKVVSKKPLKTYGFSTIGLGGKPMGFSHRFLGKPQNVPWKNGCFSPTKFPQIQMVLWSSGGSRCDSLAKWDFVSNFKIPR